MEQTFEQLIEAENPFRSQISVGGDARCEGGVDLTENPEVTQLIQEHRRRRELYPEDFEGNSQQHDALQELQERNTEDFKKYRAAGQEFALNEKARLVNLLHVKELIRKLNTIPGFEARTNDVGFPGMVGLYAKMRGNTRRVYDEKVPAGWKYICAVQKPYMPEWSVLRLDDHLLPTGYKYKGWRTVGRNLIAERAITEDEFHEAFGDPTLGAVSTLYRQQLWDLRNF